MNHTKEIRKAYKKRYYVKHNYGDEHSREPYTDVEIKLILDHKITDKEIAQKIGRSVMAIQIKRNRLKGGEQYGKHENI